MIVRNFSIGSQWLYYKIYTGVNTANFVLQDLQPVIEQLKAENKISHWFFIRYKDPNEHFRLRFCMTDLKHIGKVILKLNKVFENYINEDLIYKIQTDTYNREIERYGEKTIEASEFIFCYDSEQILSFLALKNRYENQYEIIFSCLAIHAFLDDFGLADNDKLLLLQEMQQGFKNEFNSDKNLNKQLDKNYRDLKEQLALEMTSKNDFTVILNEKSNAIQPLVEKIKNSLEMPLFKFLDSHIHMMINRQYTSNQRTYELVIYDHLYRYYKTVFFNPNYVL